MLVPLTPKGEVFNEFNLPPSPEGEVNNEFILPPAPLGSGELSESVFRKFIVLNGNRVRAIYFDYLVSLFSSPEKGAIFQHGATPYEKSGELVEP